MRYEPELYLERQAAMRAEQAADREKAGRTDLHTIEAGINVIYGNTRPDNEFRAEADTIWYSYIGARTKEEQDKAMAAYGDLWERFNRSLYGDELYEKLTGKPELGDLGSVVRGKGRLEGHVYKISLADIDKLKVWKKEVLAIIDKIEKTLANPSLDPLFYTTVTHIIGENPSKPHIDRFAICYFVNTNKAAWTIGSWVRGLAILVFGKLSNVIQFGEQKDICSDTAIVAKILAAQFDYHSEVVDGYSETDNFKITHNRLVFADGTIFDPLYYPNLHGYKIPETEQSF